MTAEQTTIFGAGATLVDGKPLTPRQQHAFDLVRRAPFGVAADEVGAAWHAVKGKHVADSICEWCAKDGGHVLRSKALAGLVTKKRATGYWFCRNPDDALVEQHQPADERPSELDGYDPAKSEFPF